MDMKSANDEDDAKKREKTKYVIMEHAFWIENTYTQLSNFVAPLYYIMALYTKCADKYFPIIIFHRISISCIASFAIVKKNN